MFNVLAILFFIVNFILFGMAFISSDMPGYETIFHELIDVDHYSFIHLFFILCWIFLIIFKNKLSQKYFVLISLLIFNTISLYQQITYYSLAFRTFEAWQKTQVQSLEKK